MSMQEAITAAAVILGIFGALATVGLLGVQVLAWAWYRWDGGRKGLLAWLRGI